MSMALADTLNAAAEVAGSVASVPGPVGVVAQITAIALRAAGAIAAAGRDPVPEITRLLSPASQLDAVRAEWNAAIERDFRPRESTRATEPAPPPSGEDIYDEGGGT